MGILVYYFVRKTLAYIVLRDDSSSRGIYTRLDLHAVSASQNVFISRYFDSVHVSNPIVPTACFSLHVFLFTPRRHEHDRRRRHVMIIAQGDSGPLAFVSRSGNDNRMTTIIIHGAIT